VERGLAFELRLGAHERPVVLRHLYNSAKPCASGAKPRKPSLIRAYSWVTMRPLSYLQRNQPYGATRAVRSSYAQRGVFS
jgi:hypothetical protein